MIQRRSFGSSSSQPQAQTPRRSARSITGTASLRYLPSGMFLQLEAPWNKLFQDEMKKSIPAKKRVWDNNDKCWYIIRDQFDKLSHLMDKHYDETILLDFPPQDVSHDAWSKLFLIPGAPLDVVQAVYKTLCKTYHPDKGGSTLKMQELNTAHGEILGEFSEKEDS